MNYKVRHNWDLSPREAIELQKQLASEVIFENEFIEPIKTVAGIDLGYEVKTDTIRAVVVILSFPDLELLETSEAKMPIQFPYVPGLLSFRETPVAIKASLPRPVLIRKALRNAPWWPESPPKNPLSSPPIGT